MGYLLANHESVGSCSAVMLGRQLSPGQLHWFPRPTDGYVTEKLGFWPPLRFSVCVRTDPGEIGGTESAKLEPRKGRQGKARHGQCRVSTGKAGESCRDGPASHAVSSALRYRARYCPRASVHEGIHPCKPRIKFPTTGLVGGNSQTCPHLRSSARCPAIPIRLIEYY